MGIKVNYNRGDGIVQIVIRDESGGKLDTFTTNQSDIKSQRRIGKIIKDKYGIDFTPYIPQESDKDGFFDF